MPNLTSQERSEHILDSLLYGVKVGAAPSEVNDSRLQTAVTDWLTHRQHGLAVTVKRIAALLGDDPEERPTNKAVESAANALIGAYSVGGQNYFPRGWATVARDRGVRIEWKHGPRRVRVAISGSQQNPASYIYFEEQGEFQSEALSAKALADRLDWLLNG